MWLQLTLICILTLSFQATSHNPTIFHHFDIHNVGTQSSSASCAMLMRPNKAETAVHGCWLLTSIFSSYFLVATGFNPFYRRRLSAHMCGFNLPLLHFDVVVSSHIPQPYHFSSLKPKSVWLLGRKVDARTTFKLFSRLVLIQKQLQNNRCHFPRLVESIRQCAPQAPSTKA